MGTFIPGIAGADPSAYGTRAARKGGRYNAFVPPNIADYPFSLTTATNTDVETGAAALKRLQALDLAPDLHSLAETLLCSERVASSRIEGLDMTHARLARARYGDVREDKKAREVIANIDAMRKAIELGASTAVLGIDAIRDIHQALIRGETLRGKPYAGVIREEQNWIGGNDHNRAADIASSEAAALRDEVEDHQATEREEVGTGLGGFRAARSRSDLRTPRWWWSRVAQLSRAHTRDAPCRGNETMLHLRTASSRRRSRRWR